MTDAGSAAFRPGEDDDERGRSDARPARWIVPAAGTGRIERASLRFLGTGTSAGVPLIGCDCVVCTSPDPRDRRLRTSGLLSFIDPEGRERGILLDCGPDLREQALRYAIRRVDAILVTHGHVDHIWGLDEVRRFNAMMGGPIDLYAEHTVLSRLREIYAHIFDPEKNVQKSFVASIIPHTIRAGVGFELYGLRVMPIRLLHGRLPIVGFRFEPVRPAPGADDLFPLAWCTDVSSISPESWPLLEGLTTLCIDGLRDRHHPTHFTTDQAADVAHRCGARRSFLIHIGHETLHERTDARLRAMHQPGGDDGAAVTDGLCPAAPAAREFHTFSSAAAAGLAGMSAQGADDESADLPDGVGLAWDGLLLTSETLNQSPRAAHCSPDR